MGLRGRTWPSRTYCKFYMKLKAYILSAILSSVWHSAMPYVPYSAFRDMPWRVAERSQFRTLVVFRLKALVIFLKYISSGINTVMDWRYTQSKKPCFGILFFSWISEWISTSEGLTYYSIVTTRGSRLIYRLFFFSAASDCSRDP